MRIILHTIICNFSKEKLKFKSSKFPGIPSGNLISGLFPGISQQEFPPVALFQWRLYIDALATLMTLYTSLRRLL